MLYFGREGKIAQNGSLLASTIIFLNCRCVLEKDKKLCCFPILEAFTLLLFINTETKKKKKEKMASTKPTSKGILFENSMKERKEKKRV